MGVDRMMQLCSMHRILLCCLVFAVQIASTRSECQASEFEAPHRDWSAACVAQWLTNINLPEHITLHFEAQEVMGKDLRGLNETVLMVPAEEGGLNVTEQVDRQKIIDGVKRL